MKPTILIIVSLIWMNVALSQNQTSTITDSRDGQTYKTIKIGEQWWMAENLNYAAENSWYYDENENVNQKYGRLYTWNSALESCPADWHLPNENEWIKMEKQIGLLDDEMVWKSKYGDDTIQLLPLEMKGWFGDSLKIGLRLKSSEAWNITGAKDIIFTRFNSFPAGFRQHMVIIGLFHIIKFKGLNESAGFWVNEKTGKYFARYRFINTEEEGLFYGEYFIKSAFSVRCVKD